MKIPYYLFALAWLANFSCFDPFFSGSVAVFDQFSNMERCHKGWSIMSKYDVFSCHECHLKWHSQIRHKSRIEKVTKTGEISSDIAGHILKCVPCHTLKKVDISITYYSSLSHCHLDMNCHSSCRVLFTCGSCDTTESGRPSRARLISEGIGVWFWRHQLHGVIFMTK
jgi:hypothetical protein